MISSKRLDIVVIPPPGFKVEHRRFDPSRPARSHDKEYRGVILDTHGHFCLPQERKIDESTFKEEIIEVLRECDVELAIFMPTPNEGRSPNHEESARQRRMLRNLDKNKIKLFCGGNYITYWLHCAYYNGHSEEELENSKILTRLSKDIDSGDYAGVGEMCINHFTKHGKQPVIQCPPNFKLFLKVVDLIARKGMWLDLHAEPVDPTGISHEKQVFGGIELLFQRNPNLKLIYSHTAMTNPTNVRRILCRYPNVMMNFKVTTSHYRWRNLEPIINDPEKELYEDWAQLFEEMPERFMVGTDAKFGWEGLWAKVKELGAFPVSRYKEWVKATRYVLGTLNPRAAKMIAYENAKKIFRID